VVTTKTQTATARDVAQTVIAALRHLRDNEQSEWDALMRTQSSVILLDLWDTLQFISAEGCPTIPRDRLKR
jgi:hypothetical protein